MHGVGRDWRADDRPAHDAPVEARRFGPFTILRPLGHGASGSVFEVHDPRLDRRAALKVLRTPAGGGAAAARAVERFVREGEALARLRHPHIVTVHEAGSIEGTPYVLMELVEGATLDRLIREGAPRQRLLGLVVQAARGLEAAHQAGIVHRDVKPQNVVADERGARVVDFGVARVLGAASLTATGGLVGTPAYLAPEALDGSDVGPVADVFGLGATLFEVLTGAAPFEGAPVFARGEVPDPRRDDPTISLALAGVVRRALDPDPAARWPSAGALADAVEAAGARGTRARVGLAVSAVAATAVLAVALGFAGATAPRGSASAAPAAPVASGRPPGSTAALETASPGLLPPLSATLRLEVASGLEPGPGRHAGRVACAAVVASVVVTGGFDGFVRVWRADGAQARAFAVAESGAAFRVRAVALSADSRVVAALAGGRVTRWEVASGRRLDTWTLGEDAAEDDARGDITVSADGARLVALNRHVAYVLLPGQAPRTLSEELVADGIALAGDGSLAATVERGMLGLWALPEGRFCRRHLSDDPRLHVLAFDPTDSTRLAAGAANGEVFYVEEGGRLTRVPGSRAGGPVRALALRGDRLVAATADAQVRAWRWSSGRWRRAADAPQAPSVVAFDEAATTFVGLAVGRARALWRDVATGADRWPAPALPEGVDALLPAGRLPPVVVSRDRLLRLEPTGGVRPLGRLPRPAFGNAQTAGERGLLVVRDEGAAAATDTSCAAVLLDLATGTTLGAWPLSLPPRAALAPDGSGVACVETGGSVVLRRPDGQDRMIAFPGKSSGSVVGVRWRADDLVVVAHRRGLELYEAGGGQRAFVDLSDTPEIVANGLDRLVPGRGDALILIRQRAPAALTTLGADGGSPLIVLGEEVATCAAAAPGGSWALTGDERGATLWDLRGAAPTRVTRVLVDADDVVECLEALDDGAALLGTRRGRVLRLRVR
jgi:hypothetical protein